MASTYVGEKLDSHLVALAIQVLSWVHDSVRLVLILRKDMFLVPRVVDRVLNAGYQVAEGQRIRLTLSR